jgi:DNA-binding MarR family transcriptional regulator/N-acetylglutamate synthase-like GNAT family acetyltransferase
MAAPPAAQVSAVRAASRRLVRELGFLREGLAGTALPPSAVHALLEIDARGRLTAAELAGLLDLDKSSVSRLLRKLVETGEVAEAPGELDGRSKALSLTPHGQAVAAGIHGHAGRQVAAALGRLGPGERQVVADGLRLYAEALAAGRAPAPPAPAVTIEAGYRPGALGRCAEMHARHYARIAGFGQPFEALVAAGLAEFAARLERPRNRLWLALRGGEVIGTVAIDGEDMGLGIAHLRWFIVADGARGGGIGRRLLADAVGFCDRQGFTETQLWTFRGLEAARHLYEAAGFVLAEERPGRQWGQEVLEQRFVRQAGGTTA